MERKHQHLLTVARALFFQSKVPLKFWGECVLTATHIINRLPSSTLNNKSPYEILHNEVLDYINFKVFEIIDKIIILSLKSLILTIYK